MRATHKCHQGGSVIGPNCNRAGYPTPASADRCPAAIMKRGKAPRLVFYPGPTPGRDPHPVPVAIGHPVHRHPAGVPHRSVGTVSPTTIGVKVVIARNIVADIGLGSG